ncbi:MAG: N-acetylgalactosamine-6-sulfatase, partial [Roseimicrobium sp.]
SEATPQHVDGISFAPTLLGKTQPERPFLYREFPNYGGQQCVRHGDWKGVRQRLKPTKKQGNAKPDLTIELYNIKEDMAETKNVAGAHPEVVAQIEALMQSQHLVSKDFPFPALDGKAP